MESRPKATSRSCCGLSDIGPEVRCHPGESRDPASGGPMSSRRKPGSSIRSSDVIPAKAGIQHPELRCHPGESRDPASGGPMSSRRKPGSSIRRSDVIPAKSRDPASGGPMSSRRKAGIQHPELRCHPGESRDPVFQGDRVLSYATPSRLRALAPMSRRNWAPSNST